MPAVIDPLERARDRIRWATLSLGAAAADLDEVVGHGDLITGPASAVRAEAVAVAGLLDQIDHAKTAGGRNLRRVQI